MIEKADNFKNPEVNEEIFVFPLSFQQEALWFLDQLEPGLPTYNISVCYNVTGNLNIEILQQALDVIIDRHEALRTGFREIKGQVSQVVHAHLKAKIIVENIVTGEVEPYQKALRKAKNYASYGFDLDSNSLFRSIVIKYGSQECIVLFVLHHIIFDGWSVGIFMNELSRIYNALLLGEKVELDQPQLQYADFAVWQREWFQSEAREKHMTFWRERLGGRPDPLELPTDLVRPAKQRFRGDFKLINIPKPHCRFFKWFVRERVMYIIHGYH